MRLVVVAFAAASIATAAQAAAPVAGKLVPSRAVGVTHDCASFYPQLSEFLGESGDVELEYDVGADGVIGNVKLRRTSGFDRLDKAALECVRQAWRNEPAQVDGKQVVSPGHVAVIRFMGGPQTGQEYFERGLWYVDHGSYDAAISDFDMALRLDPTRKDVSLARADAVAAKSENRSARIPSAPRQPQPLMSGEKPSSAVAGTHDCAKYFPVLSARLYEEGSILIAYDVGVDGSIGNVTIRRSSGFDRLDKAALDCVQTAWKNTPAMMDGKPIASAGHLAIITFAIAPPETADDYLARGSALDARGEHDRAIADFTAAIALNPYMAEAYTDRALAYASVGKPDLARADRDKAAALRLRK